MKILAIETSCDETAIALVEASGGLRRPRIKILENLVASQVKIHRPFGGVVPSLAKREHQKNLPILLKKIMNHELRIKNKKIIIPNSKFIIPKIDLIAVTVGPGLEPALWTGIEFAKNLYLKLKTKNSKLKLVGANHLEGHLYSFLLSQKRGNSKLEIRNSKFPAIALLVSGGHTILLLMKSLTQWKKLGETKDDAAGEAFDKVARLLNLPYPGGPEIEKLALSVPKGWRDTINFPRPMLNQKNYDFSFSGLKTAVLYHLQDQELKTKNLKLKADVAASFQQAVIDVLTGKTLRATKEFSAKSIILCGGVAINNSLRNYFKLKVKREKLKVNLIIPFKEFCADNAAMMAAAVYIHKIAKKKSHKIKADGNLTI
jgi:N6-L-threonylcarbamoyladenine synthase